MEDKLYIVTLYKHEDLEQFYKEMQLSNFPLVMKRPMSRNTHYMMTEEQAERLRQDPRVWAVELTPEEKGMTMKRCAINYTPYAITGTFWKDDTQGPATVSSTDRQWGHIHCAGDPAQRGKGQFGPISQGGTYENTTGTVNVFSDGKHVDVVICDDPVSYDCDEWISPTTGQTRFNQYDWYTELNSIVSTIDDDGITLPSGSYPNYFTNASNTESHGTHVCGTVAGQHYGWATEANIYSMQVLSNASGTGTPVPALLIFDYLRAFHSNKSINPDTGVKNPTITNHSWGYGYDLSDLLEKASLAIGDINSVTYNSVQYTVNNPNPSGWTMAGLEADFGIGANKMDIPADYPALNADVEDAIEEGIVVIGAAGNDNFHMVTDTDSEWDNIVNFVGLGNIFFNRGSSPVNARNAIRVGALSKREDFRRSTYTNYGPAVSVFAPGDNILSAYNSAGLADGKYGGAPNYYYPIQGTSMASPQVAGIAACLASGKDRFTNEDILRYLQQNSIDNDMTFDLSGGLFNDNTCKKNSPDKYLHAVNPREGLTGMISPQVGARKTGLTYPRIAAFNRDAPAPLPKTFPISVTNSGSSHYVFNGDDRSTTHVDANDPTININLGDKIDFSLNVSGHPFWVKTSATTGTGNAATGVVNNGTTTVTCSFTPTTAGTYYYICQFHSAMQGQIVVS